MSVSNCAPTNWLKREMTIRHLRTLLAIAETKTFTAAADVVHVTHAAVSQQMKALEDDLGVALFDRKSRTPELTPLGHQVVEKARALVADYDNLIPSIVNDGGLEGTISIGVMRTTLTGLTPRAMLALKSKYPQMGLHIRPGLTSTLLAEIERKNLDAAIISKPQVLPVGFTFRELAHEPMQLITSLQEPDDDPIALLTTRPFIRFNRDAVVGALIENWIQSNRIQVMETMELDSPEAITSMVNANLGVSIVPDLAVKPIDATSVKRISLGTDAPVRILGLVHSEKSLKIKALDELYKALTSVIEAATAQK